MADTPKKKSFLFPALALVLGLVAGVVTVYVTGGFNGNGQTQAKVAQTSQTCTLREGMKDALKAAAIGDVATMRIADKPKLITDVAYTMPDGAEKTFQDRNGKLLLLNIWATWCGPCREEMPDLADLQKTYGSDKFEVFALNVDRNGGDKPQKFLKSINADALALYLDPANKSFQALRSKALVFGLPTTMIVDGDGCVQGVMPGIAHWGSADAKNLVEVMMAELTKKRLDD